MQQIFIEHLEYVQQNAPFCAKPDLKPDLIVGAENHYIIAQTNV